MFGPRSAPSENFTGTVLPAFCELTAGGSATGGSKPPKGQNTSTVSVFVFVLPAWSDAETTMFFGPIVALRFMPLLAGAPFTVAEQLFRPEPTSAQEKCSSVPSSNVTGTVSP